MAQAWRRRGAGVAQAWRKRGAGLIWGRVVGRLIAERTYQWRRVCPPTEFVGGGGRVVSECLTGKPDGRYGIVDRRLCPCIFLSSVASGVAPGVARGPACRAVERGTGRCALFAALPLPLSSASSITLALELHHSLHEGLYNPLVVPVALTNRREDRIDEHEDDLVLG